MADIQRSLEIEVSLSKEKAQAALDDFWAREKVRRSQASSEAASAEEKATRGLIDQLASRASAVGEFVSTNKVALATIGTTGVAAAAAIERAFSSYMNHAATQARETSKYVDELLAKSFKTADALQRLAGLSGRQGGLEFTAEQLRGAAAAGVDVQEFSRSREAFQNQAGYLVRSGRYGQAAFEQVFQGVLPNAVSRGVDFADIAPVAADIMERAPQGTTPEDLITQIVGAMAGLEGVRGGVAGNADVLRRSVNFGVGVPEAVRLIGATAGTGAENRVPELLRSINRMSPRAKERLGVRDGMSPTEILRTVASGVVAGRAQGRSSADLLGAGGFEDVDFVQLLAGLEGQGGEQAVQRLQAVTPATVAAQNQQYLNSQIAQSRSLESRQQEIQAAQSQAFVPFELGRRQAENAVLESAELRRPESYFESFRRNFNSYVSWTPSDRASVLQRGQLARMQFAGLERFGPIGDEAAVQLGIATTAGQGGRGRVVNQFASDRSLQAGAAMQQLLDSGVATVQELKAAITEWKAYVNGTRAKVPIVTPSAPARIDNPK